MSDFTLATTTQEPNLDTAMKVVYQWNYDPEVEELRRQLSQSLLRIGLARFVSEVVSPLMLAFATL